MATNLELQLELNEAIEETAKLLDIQTNAFKSQTEIVTKLVTAVKSIGLNGMADNLEKLSDVLEKVGNSKDGLVSTEQAIKNISKSLEEATTGSGMLGKTIEILQSKQMKMATIGAAAFDGFIGGMKFTKNALTGVLGLTTKVLGAVGHLAAAIITAPFKMLAGLISMSNASGDNALATALEEVRKQLGYLNKEGGGAVVQLARSMKGQLAETGISVYRVFGNLAERLKYMLEYAKNLGPIFDTMYTKIGAGGAEALGAFNKALGFTAEGQKAIAIRAKTSGVEINEVNREIANYSIQLSNAFGLTMKEVSRSVGEMMADMKTFGHLSVKELTQTAVYARRLGIEIKALGGLMDKFANFEEAATGASQLSQAFGLNIDAIKLMNAQNPADKIEQLRKAFFRAGKSIETMTYQERRLLASQTGLDDAAVGLAFSLKSQGQSYSDVQKKADMAKKKQITQTEAMQKLAGAIERLVQSGSSGGGFLDRFFRGFEKGIRWSREFREIMMNLRRTLNMTERAGIQVGRAFVQAFPGVKDFFKGIAGFFEPRKFQVMLNKVVEGFRGFFKDLTDSPQTALPKLLEKLKTGFFDYFSTRESAGQKFLTGLKSFFTAFSHIANSLLKTAIGGVTKAIRFITDIITGRVNLSGAGQAAGGTGGFLLRMLGNVFKDVMPVAKELGKAIQALLAVVWEKVSPYVKQYGTKFVLMLFAPSLASMMAKTLTALLLQAAFTGGLKALQTLGGWWAKKSADAATKGVDAVQTAASKAGSAAKSGAGATGALGSAGANIQAANVANEAAMKSRINGSSIVKMLAVAALIAVGIVAVLVGIAIMAKKIKDNNLSVENIAAASMAMIAAAGVVLAAGLVIRTASGISVSSAFKAIPALLAIVGVVYGMVALAELAVDKFKRFTLSDVAKATAMMGAISLMTLAAAGVVAVAAVVGAIVSNGYGALFAVAGLAFIGLVVAGMVKGTMSIMEEIKKFNPGSGFKEKAEVFVDIIKAVGSFAGSLLGSIAAASPGITGMIASSFFGNDPQQEMQKTLGRIVTIIEAMGTQVVRIITTITRFASQMSPAEIERGKALATILESIASLSGAMGPPAALFSDTSAWFEGSDVTRKLEQFQNTITLMGRTMANLIGSIGTFLGRLPSGVTEETLKAGKLVAEILGAVGVLAQALMPKPALLVALNGSADFAGALSHLGDYSRQLLTTVVGSGVLTSISEFIKGMITQMTGVRAADMEKVKAIAPIIVGSMSAIAQLSTLLGSVMPTSPGRPINAALVTSLTDFMKTFLGSIAGVIPRIIHDSLAALEGVNAGQIELFKKFSGAVVSIFDILGRIRTISDAFMENIPSQGNRRGITRNSMQTLIQSIDIIGSLTRQVFSNENIKTAIQQIASFQMPRNLSTKLKSVQGLFELLRTIPESLRAIDGIRDSGNVGDKLKGAIEAITSGASGLANLPTTTQTGLNALLASATTLKSQLMTFTGQLNNLQLARTAESAVTQLQSAQFERVGGGLREMVKQINEISEQLNHITPINLNTRLKAIATEMGLGARGNFEVRNRNFNINVGFNVTMDARELETALISLPNRRINITG